MDAEILKNKKARYYNYIIDNFRCLGLRHFRYKILFKLNVIHDSSTVIRKGVYFDDPSKVHIGRNCLINTNVHFYTGVSNDSQIQIGDYTKIGMNSILITVTHEIGDSECRAGKPICDSISVGKGCWIGAGAIILPGVKVGDGCIIGAGSVVTKNCLPNALYVGVPAKKVRDLP